MSHRNKVYTACILISILFSYKARIYMLRPLTALITLHYIPQVTNPEWQFGIAFCFNANNVGGLCA